MARLASAQFGVLSSDQLRRVGLSGSAISRRVKKGSLERLLPRVYRLGAFPSSWEQRVMAATLWAGQEAVASHETAVTLWNLAGIHQPRTVTISSVGSSKKPAPWIVIKRVQQLHRRDRATRQGIPVTTPSRTLLDLGDSIAEEPLEQALDSALRLGLTSIPRLRWQLEVSGGKGVRGSAALRKLVADRDRSYVPTHSVLETRFRKLLKNYGFPQPSQQHVVWRDSGGRAFVDFCYPAVDLAIEVDGYASHGDRVRWNKDLRRQNDLVIGGWRVLRFTWDDLRSREAEVVRQLRTFFPRQLSLGSLGPRSRSARLR